MADDALIAFLNARLDEDEAAAQAVAPLGHVYDMGSTRLDEAFSHSRIRYASEDGRSWLEPDQAAGQHFARHDPARVLREIAAKRAIIAAHPLSDATERQRIGRAVSFGCMTCHIFDGVLEPFGYCVTLLALAPVFSDHPDYRPEWKPELATWIP